MNTYTPLKIVLEGMAIAALIFAFSNCGKDSGTCNELKYDSKYDLFLPDNGADAGADADDVSGQEIGIGAVDIADSAGLIEVSDAVGLDQLTQIDVLEKDIPGIDDIPEDILIIYGDIINQDDPVLGSPDAPVTIVGFGGYQCPFTKKFHDMVFPQLKSEYIDAGTVKFAYKDLPMPFHQYSYQASEAAECAKVQGKFWEFHDLLFANAMELNEEMFEALAGQLGLDAEQFKSCLFSGKYSAKIEDDIAKAEKGRPLRGGVD